MSDERLSNVEWPDAAVRLIIARALAVITVTVGAASDDAAQIDDLLELLNSDAGDRMQKIRAASAKVEFSRNRTEAQLILELNVVSRLQRALVVALRLNRVREPLEDARHPTAFNFNNRSLNLQRYLV